MARRSSGLLALAVLSAVLAAGLSACETAITSVGNFPGAECADRDSVNMIRVNYESRQAALALREPPEIAPDLVAVEDVVEVLVDPNGPGGHRRFCRGMARFADGTEQPVYSSWLRDWQPNLVSGPGFRWCVGDLDGVCADALP